MLEAAALNASLMDSCSDVVDLAEAKVLLGAGVAEVVGIGSLD